jgi:hypothetical protein
MHSSRKLSPTKRADAVALNRNEAARDSRRNAHVRGVNRHAVCRNPTVDPYQIPRCRRLTTNHARGLAKIPVRLEDLVRSRSRSSAGSDSMSSVQRQRQFPSARPGKFIRASVPRFSTSWSGTMANAATDDHARRINSHATSLLSPLARFR